MQKEIIKQLLEKFGGKYSTKLGIDLSKRDSNEVFKWFLASILFGAPIAETSVIKTYKCFEKHGVITPQKILKTGWQGLVDMLDEGSYTRYDFKTADKLLEVMGNLVAQYEGDLNFIHEQTLNSTDLEKNLKNLGKGIGNITVSIFLRELRGIWKKADSKPTPLVILAARNLGIVRTRDSKKTLKELKNFWKKNKVLGKDFINFESALLRLGKDFCRKEKCEKCLVKEYCMASKF